MFCAQEAGEGALALETFVWLGGFGDLLVVGSRSAVSGLLEGELGFDGLEPGGGRCESTGVGECAGILHRGGGADGIGCCYGYIE